MLIITPKELIETLKRYQPDEQLLVTWWSTEDVEYLLTDESADTDKAQEIWDEVIDTLDKNTSDFAISYVNDELSSLVHEKLEETNG